MDIIRAKSYKACGLTSGDRFSLRSYFGVKYCGKEHAEHLMSVLKEHYDVTDDWEGEISSELP